MTQLGDMEDRLVQLVQLSKIYKKPPIRGYLFSFKDTRNFGIVTGNGYTHPLTQEDVLLIHKQYIIIE